MSQKLCRKCGGSGKKGYARCTACRGTGYVNPHDGQGEKRSSN